MPNKPGRIIIDTNIFISFLISGRPAKLADIIFSADWVLIFSDELLAELIEVAKRPKFRSFFSLLHLEDLIILLHKHGNSITVKTKVDECRDEKDNFLLSLAIDGNADILLTGDDDLLVLKSYQKTVITTITVFFNNTGITKK